MLYRPFLIWKRTFILLICPLILAAVTLACGFTAPSAAPTIPPVATVQSVPPPQPVVTVQVERPAIVVNLEEQVISVYNAVGPSVVNITSLAYVYDFFMGSVPQEGSGSGFIFTEDGNIVTNYHVIQNAEKLIVTLASGKKFPAEVVGADPSNDLAVIHIDAGADLPPPLGLSDSNQLRVGQFVVAIGAPFGLEQTLTTGVVSALGRVIESPQANQFIGEAIQTDAAINPGNSGGPLLNLMGEVIGVNSQILSTSGSSAGVGFAISANTVARVAPDLIATGRYQHPWLGIQTLDLNDYTISVLQDAGMIVNVDSGVLIVGFESRSPARAAGMSSGDRQARFGRYILPLDGDIITAINGTPVQKMEDLTVYLELQTKIGETVQITIQRLGEEQTLPVTLAVRPSQN